MGLMDKFKKGGGGFLNNVDALIVGLKFTTEPDFGTEAPERAKGDFTPLWVELTVRVDGSEEDQTTHLFAGSADDFVITEDGMGLEPIEGAMLWGSTSFARLYGSMVEHGLEDVEPEEGEPLSFAHVVGARCRFVQVKDEEAMKRAAKNAAKSKGRINAQGQRKGKDGKYYDIRTPEVTEIYSTGNDVSAPKKGKGAKPAPKQAGSVKGAALAKPKIVKQDTDISDFAVETLIDILGDEKDNAISKSKLNLAITKKLVKDPRRDDVRMFLYEDANLLAIAEAGVITYDKASKAQTIALA